MDWTTMPRRPGAPASRGGAAAPVRDRIYGLAPGEAGLRRLVDELEARVTERNEELARTHAEYELAHAELEAVNDELQRLLRSVCRPNWRIGRCTTR